MLIKSKNKNIILKPYLLAIPRPINGAAIFEIPNEIEYNAAYCPCRSACGLDKAKFIIKGMANISENVMMTV